MISVGRRLFDFACHCMMLHIPWSAVGERCPRRAVEIMDGLIVEFVFSVCIYQSVGAVDGEGSSEGILPSGTSAASPVHC